MGSIAEGDRKGKGGGDYRPLGDDASWTTVHKNTLGLEGLTADAKGNLYSPARNPGGACPVVRVPADGGTAVTVGTIPTPCSPAGLAFDERGDLYVTNFAQHLPAAAGCLQSAGGDRVRDRRARRQRRRVRRARRRCGCPTEARVKGASRGPGPRRRIERNVRVQPMAARRGLAARRGAGVPPGSS